MFRWTPYAMVRISLFFIAGILWGIYHPGSIHERFGWLLLVAILASYFMIVAFLVNRHGLRILSGALGLMAIFLFGYLHLLHRIESRSGHHLSTVNEPIKYYEARVRSAPESKSKSWRMEVEVIRVKTNEWFPANGKVLLYISKKYMEKVPWQYRDRLLIKGSPVAISPPSNPFEFDFKRFLSFRNIYHQQFIMDDDIRKSGETNEKGIIYYSYQARAWASSQLNRYIDSDQERVIAAALVLGVTEGIDTDLQNAYAASGAMHVLAVSGLHVGIIYGMLLLFLRPLNRFAWSKWVVFGISIIALWSFAFITGLSPSVLRAVTMFSFIALARPLGWRTNIYNTLAGSAFLLLLFNPYLIMSVGFQLSYLAVMGIVYLQRPLYHLWEIENRVGDWVWQITCVSLAAQAATFALGMLYFHQFPVYFLVSNLFVIPLATAVLIFGILLLVCSPWSSAAWIVGQITSWLIKVLNWIVFAVEDLPFSLVEDVHLSTFQFWVIMIFFLALVFMAEFKQMRWLYLAAVCSVILTVSQWIHFKRFINQRQFVVYNVNGFSAMEWIDNGQSYFWVDSAFAQNQERVRFHIGPNRLNSGVTSIHSMIPFQKELGSGVHLFQWNGKSIVFIRNKNYVLPKSVEIDYLVVGKNAIKTKGLSDSIKVKKVILDGSNSKNYVRQWKEVLKKEKIAVHAVAEEGAFILTK